MNFGELDVYKLAEQLGIEIWKSAGNWKLFERDNLGEKIVIVLPQILHKEQDVENIGTIDDMSGWFVQFYSEPDTGYGVPANANLLMNPGHETLNH